ncbi:MAG: hypothetical protein H6601_12175 [Flavobacteriales bacterium]|nr:hypothetical protein [Flavobacteriales bacterium]MCB9205477.1 hypothetical protein [Flavobacteriales bacterium]
MSFVARVLKVFNVGSEFHYLLQQRIVNELRHGWYVSDKQHAIGDTVDVDIYYLERGLSGVSGNGIGHLNHKLVKPLKNGYNKNTPLRFGLYKDLELGGVFALDQKYVGWCIENVEDFFIVDLHVLYDFGVYTLSESGDYTLRLDKDDGPRWFIKAFGSIDNMSEKLEVLNTEFRFSEELEHLNELKRSK